MPASQQATFSPDDEVYVRTPDGTKKVGTIVKVYKVDNKWRYIVQFFNGEQV